MTRIPPTFDERVDEQLSSWLPGSLGGRWPGASPPIASPRTASGATGSSSGTVAQLAAQRAEHVALSGTAVQSIPDATPTDLAWDTIAAAPNEQRGFTQVEAGGSQIPVDKAGMLWLGFELEWDTFAGGGTVEVVVDTGGVEASYTIAESSSGRARRTKWLTWHGPVQAGDLPSVRVTQSSGDAQDMGVRTLLATLVPLPLAAEPCASAWDITVATLAASKDVSGQEAFPRDVTFSGDGTKMFVGGQDDYEVHRYDLATAWDLSTAAYVSTFDASGEVFNLESVDFSADGAVMLVSTGDSDVFAYDLGTPWDITTAVHSATLDTSSEDSSAYSAIFSPDGTMVFFYGDSWQRVYRYDLSTPWDVTTASYVSLFDVSGEASNTYDVAFSPDGTRMFIVDNNNDVVIRYDLSTAWDITTATYTSQVSVVSEEGVPAGLAFSPDGRRMFIVGDNQAVYQYDLCGG